MIRIINDDCRNVMASIMEEYRDRQIIIVSDPPFNIGYRYHSYKDRMKEDEYLKMMKAVFVGDCVIINYPETLYKIAFALGKVPERVVSWVYNSNTARQHRDIAFFGIKPDFTKVIQPYKNPNDKRIRRNIANGKLGCKLYDWWNVNQVKNVSKDKTEHPCQMPLEVMKNIIGILPEDALIVDPFMGSGTTGLACCERERDFIGIELDESYCKIAEERLRGFINGQDKVR